MTGDPSAARLAARRRRAAGTATDFDGARLALARRLARQPRTALAAHTSVTPAAITQYERGQARPTAPVLAELSLALGVPADFFRHGQAIQALSPSAAHFRSLRATSALARDQALAFAELALAVLDTIEQYVDLPVVDLPEHPVNPDDPPSAVIDAARATRAHLQIGKGPVSHVVRLLEAHGVLVLRLPRDLIDRKVDAFSTRAPTRPIVLLSPEKNDKARSRFDTAHELGHLVMHPDVEPGSKIVENQAHAFAAEFLMPADQVLDDLPSRLDWEQLHAAKRRWGTSLRALVYRAHTLERMSDAVYRRANMQLAEQGNPEAGPLGPPESPSLLGNAMQLLSSHGTPLDHLANAARLPMDQTQRVIDAGSNARLRLSVER